MTQEKPTVDILLKALRQAVKDKQKQARDFPSTIAPVQRTSSAPGSSKSR
jgi:hypothetical protein